MLALCPNQGMNSKTSIGRDLLTDVALCSAEAVCVCLAGSAAVLS